LAEIFPNVHDIIIDGEKTEWIVKEYKLQKYCKEEATILEKLKNIKGVPKILWAHFSDKLGYVIISKAKGMDLFEYMKKNGTLNEDDVKIISKKFLNVLRAIHSKNIIHKDIKPENIIYDSESKDITLIDFEGKESELFKSPEQNDGKKLTKKTDIWSAGITIYSLLRGKTPFKNLKDYSDKEIPMKKGWSESLKNFLRCMLEKDIDLRYTAEELLRHEWLI